jgi:hypothetical protein
VAVRPFKWRGKFKLFVDLEAPCAVEGCEEFVFTTKEVHQWMASRHVARCCFGHRYKFSTPMVDAWKTSEERQAKPPKVERKAKPPAAGVNERAVLEAIEVLAMVKNAARVSEVVEVATGLMQAQVAGRRDTRRQRAVRALESLRKDGRLALSGDVVLL